MLSLDDPKVCLVAQELTVPVRGIFNRIEGNSELSLPVGEISGLQGVMVKVFISWEHTMERLLKQVEQ